MYTQYTILIIKKTITPEYSKFAAMGFFSWYRLKNEFETAVVNEPSVFEPLKFYCTLISYTNILKHGLRFSFLIARTQSPRDTSIL